MSGKLKRLSLLAAVLACCLAWPAPGQAGVFPFPIQELVLENGLQVIFIPYDSPGLVSYFTLVRAGSRNEVEPGHTGFAHFFEHMMFRGTEKYPAGARDGIITAMGGDDNAFTSTDFTGYFVVAPADGLAKIVELEADRFQNLKYSLEAYQTESRAVLGEYNKNRAIPERQMYEALYDTAFTTHTYKHTPIGFLKDIEAMPGYYEYSVGFFKRFYTPDNCTIFVVGDFDPARAGQLIRQHYGGWKTKAQNPAVRAEPEQKQERRTHVSWSTSTLPRLMMGYKTPSFGENLKDAAALAVLSGYAFGETSPAYQALVLKDRTALVFEASFELKRDPSLFTVSARVEDPAQLKTVEQTVTRTLEALGTASIDSTRLEAIKSNLRYDLLMGLNTGLGVARTQAIMTAQSCRPQGGACVGDVGNLERYFEAVQQVSSEDLKRVAKTYLVPSRRTVVTLSSGGAR